MLHTFGVQANLHSSPNIGPFALYLGMEAIFGGQLRGGGRCVLHVVNRASTELSAVLDSLAPLLFLALWRSMCTSNHTKLATASLFKDYKPSTQVLWQLCFAHHSFPERSNLRVL